MHGSRIAVTIRIAMWSGPRNISTAMMRSFGSRADTSVSDEPFYGAYLKHSGSPHPMASEVIATMDCDWQSVLTHLTEPDPEGRPIWYQKHMWHHMVGTVGAEHFSGFRHAFLIRQPAQMIASYLAKRESVTLADLGLVQQAAFFERECQRLGYPPPVVDAADVLADPQATLAKLCAALAIDWDPAMLKWAPGRRATDGIWAAHWYARVEASTGFEPESSGPDEARALDAHNQKLAEACEPFYQQLAAHRLRATAPPLTLCG